MRTKCRLQVALSHAGVASRRKAAQIISKGRVTVNGSIVRERGYAVDPGKDRISVDGKTIRRRAKAYLLLNKPPGYITTLADERGRRSVADLIPGKYAGVAPVGRLDRKTSGLLLLTNDGDMAFRLSHPSSGVEKRYSALCNGKLTERECAVLQKGIVLDGRRTARCRISVLKSAERETRLLIELHEGRKHQVRRMLGALGHTVTKLERVGYAFLTLKGLKKGGLRELDPTEITRLKEL